MNNHYHLLIETPWANLSRIMPTINPSYTVYINRRYQRSGHLFQRRFKAILVDKDEYWLPLGRYIHLHPVRAETGRKPKDYPWTRYPVFMGGKGDPLVETSETLLHFGKRAQRARRNYRAFVEGAVDVENSLRDLTQGILGGEEFLESVLAHVDSSSPDEEIPRSQRFPREVSVPAVIERVAGFYGGGRTRK